MNSVANPPLSLFGGVDLRGVSIDSPETLERTLKKHRSEDATTTPNSVPSPDGKKRRRLEESEDKAKMKSEQSTPADTEKNFYKIIYRIDCLSSYNSNCHRSGFYEEEPILAHDQKIHFAAQGRISQWREYFEANENLAFVCIREFKCNVGAGWDYKHGKQTERLLLWSETIRSALSKVAAFHHQIPMSQLAKTPTSKWWAGADDSHIYDLSHLEVSQPDLFFFHHRQLLETYALQHPSARAHIGALMRYVSDQYSRSWVEADDLFKNSLVNHEHVVRLLPPNSIILHSESSTLRAFVLQDWPTRSGHDSFKIDCWYWHPHSHRLERRAVPLTLRLPPERVIPIDKLNIVPIAYACNDNIKALLLRGQKLWALLNQYKGNHISYEGWNIERDEYYNKARFMVDYPTYHKIHPKAPPFVAVDSFHYSYDPRRQYLEADVTPSEEELSLLPPDLYGFDLTNKKWIHLSVESCLSVEWNKMAFERLVLPSQAKGLVKALVSVRASSASTIRQLGSVGNRDDVIAGKGKGLIMLLHGGPGTGKTLTAESVAEIAEMPLYRVTCGDIGTEAKKVEEYLGSVFYLGKKWNCVLLLDEADVFLEERSLLDLQRNSLVAVFLRMLEYYDGILILTSNRVGTFDEAFKSRIQVSLYFEPLSRVSRRKIWCNLIDMLEEDEANAALGELRQHVEDISEYEMNGRVIRNSLTTARQLALFKGERLEWRHLEQALNIYLDFDKYSKDRQGHTDDQWAREEKLR